MGILSVFDKFRDTVVLKEDSTLEEKSIPAYYIFNNEELDRILEVMPKNRQELEKARILSDVKLKLHGDEILKIINNQ